MGIATIANPMTETDSLTLVRPGVALRGWMTLLGLSFAFLVSCYFYGVGFNPIFLVLVYLGPIAFLSLEDASSLAVKVRSESRFFLWCLVAMLAIAGHHLFLSVSPDSSFIPSLVLASLPLWALCVALSSQREMLLRIVTGVVFLFAGVSVYDYVVTGQRAHAPLWDPSNYATLLYLVWIPWICRALGTEHASVGRCLWLCLASAAVALALLATQSRVALLVVLGSAPLVLVATLRFRLSWRAPAFILVGLAAALAFYWLQDARVVAGAVSAGGETTSEAHRMKMLESTFAAVRDYSGLMGTGLYSFSLLYPLYRSPVEQETTGLFVHNDLLQIFLEGGVWLTLPLLVFIAWVGTTGVRQGLLAKRWDPNIGLIVALALAILNSVVNFVFYVLPLLIVIGMLVGCYWGASIKEHGGGQAHRAARRYGIARWALVLALVVNTAYLAVDALTYGVFSNQLHVPGARALRSSPERMLSFSRWVQAVNGERGIPVLAEAQLLEQAHGRDTRPLQLVQARLAHAHAIEVDPWNPLAFTAYAEFLARHPDANPEGAQAAGAEILRLHGEALSLNPANARSNLTAIERAAVLGDERAVIQIAENVLEWCRVIARDGPQAAALFDRSRTVFATLGQDDKASRLTRCEDNAAATNNSGKKEPTWMMLWLRAQSEPAAPRSAP